MSKASIAAGRFGLGAQPGDLANIKTRAQSWLLDQLQGPNQPVDELRQLPSSAELLVEVQELRRDRRKTRQSGVATDKRYGRTIRQHYLAQVNARYVSALNSETPFHERLVHFWTNHFAVSADKQPLPAIAGMLENEAVRPHVSGKFIDLLLAVEKHPAMLLYLDNQRSIGPNSKLGRRATARRPDRQAGLNENLAREILELHTLGVDGGYTQGDVTTFANVLTGWSIGGTSEQGRFSTGSPGEFAFRGDVHEPGSKIILGKTYHRDGVSQGEAVLRDLAVHPSTARFLSWKLARHLVADNPPVPLVDAMTTSYLRSGGDLSTVYQTMIESEDAWLHERSKYKTPHDFLISTMRAFEYTPPRAQFVVSALDLMGQTPFRPGSPAGWPDTAEAWGGADALYKRIEWSDVIAHSVGARANPIALGDAILGDTFNAKTRKSIARAESLTQGMTLLLASPDFQRR